MVVDFNEIGVLYIIIYKRFIEHLPTKTKIKEMNKIMMRYHNIPKVYCPVIIKEMEKKKLIEKVNCREVRLLNKNLVLSLENTSKLYEKYNLY